LLKDRKTLSWKGKYWILSLKNKLTELGIVTMTFVLKRPFRIGVTYVIPKLVAKVVSVLLGTKQ